MRIVEVKGKDSGDFLQRVTAGRVRSVPVGGGQAGLLLNGQSRVLAQFDLLRTESAAYLLVSPEACAPALAEELERLHFAEKLELILTNRVAGALAAPGSARAGSGAFAFTAKGGALRWPAPVPGFDFSTTASGFPVGWDFARIGALVPWPPHDWNASTPALEAGALPWIDREKGCYPGQEVVERSLNVGHPARVLVAWEGVEPLAPGQKIAVGQGEGAVTSVAEEQGRVRALVRLSWALRDQVPQGWIRLRSHW